MTLEDFEKELARERQAEEREREHKDRRSHRHHHHHRQRNRSGSRDRESKYDKEGHRSKRPRRSREEEEHNERHHRHRSHRPRDKALAQSGRDPEDDVKTDDHSAYEIGLKRDAWMEAPSSLDVDYVSRPRRPSSPPKFNAMETTHELKLHQNELNGHLRDLKEGKAVDDLEAPATHEVDYEFGDAGSSWRMTKLKAVYREAEESNRRIEEVALDRYGSLREFDDAREEEIELGRRETYGEGYVGKVKPSGELFQERKLDQGIHRHHTERDNEYPVTGDLAEGVVAPALEPKQEENPVDQSKLNRMKAQLLRAQMTKDPKAAELEKAYNEALAASQNKGSDLVTLGVMDSRMLSGAPRNEVKAVSGRRAQERGQVEENEDMSIEDMIREERRDRGQPGGEGQRLADRIAKDAKFDNDLEYMDENAAKLAKRVHKSEINLRNTAINEYQKVNKILDNCPLCYHDDTGQPPAAPVVSLATRTYLTLPTEPELSSYGAVIVPLQHRTNLLECDDDEWEEVRNFMKSLTRLYHDQGRDVIFYENAAFPHRRPHAALNAVPLPYDLGETAPAFFKEAFLSSEDEWSQHKKVIDTLARSRELGKLAFRRSLVKEMPYFHVWFNLDGGVGHVVEDPQAWPKGDLFARQVIGGMLDLDSELVRKQGRWQHHHHHHQHRGGGGDDDGRPDPPRLDAFKKKWRKFDWTRILTEG